MKTTIEVPIPFLIKNDAKSCYDVNWSVRRPQSLASRDSELKAMSQILTGPSKPGTTTDFFDEENINDSIIPFCLRFSGIALTFIPRSVVKRSPVRPCPLLAVLSPSARPVVAEEPYGSPLVAQESVSESVMNGDQVASQKLAAVASLGPDLLGGMQIVAVVEAGPLDRADGTTGRQQRN